MAKCPSCNKFAGLEPQDPEVDMDCSVEFNLDSKARDEERIIRLTGSVRIVLNSACCGDEMKESNFEVDDEVEIPKPYQCACDAEEFELEVISEEFTEEGGGSRYAKKFYGAEVGWKVSCQCGKTVVEGTWKDQTQASFMDELN